MKPLIVYCGDCLWLLLLATNVKSDLWSLLLSIDVTNSSSLQNGKNSFVLEHCIMEFASVVSDISRPQIYTPAYLTMHKNQSEMEGISIV